MKRELTELQEVLEVGRARDSRKGDRMCELERRVEELNAQKREAKQQLDALLRELTESRKAISETKEVGERQLAHVQGEIRR